MSDLVLAFRVLVNPFLHISSTVVRKQSTLELYGLHAERQLVIGCHGGDWQLASVASSSAEPTGEPTSGWKTSRTCSAVGC